MNAIYDFALRVADTFPPWALAMLLGWLVSIGVTQPLKFVMPLAWPAETRARVAWVVAFGSAFGTTLYLYQNPLGIILAVIVGLWSPTAYAILVAFLRHRWPWAADVLSGDVRGILTGQRRENRE